jgi:hypothetical protein
MQLSRTRLSRLWSQHRGRFARARAFDHGKKPVRGEEGIRLPPLRQFYSAANMRCVQNDSHLNRWMPANIHLTDGEDSERPLISKRL